MLDARLLHGCIVVAKARNSKTLCLLTFIHLT